MKEGSTRTIVQRLFILPKLHLYPTTIGKMQQTSSWKHQECNGNTTGRTADGNQHTSIALKSLHIQLMVTAPQQFVWNHTQSLFWWIGTFHYALQFSLGLVGVRSFPSPIYYLVQWPLMECHICSLYQSKETGIDGNSLGWGLCFKESSSLLAPWAQTVSK